MATKSITKTVNIKKKSLAQNLVLALENAEGKTAQPVLIDKKVKDMTKEDIQKTFGDNNGRV